MCFRRVLYSYDIKIHANCPVFPYLFLFFLITQKKQNLNNQMTKITISLFCFIHVIFMYFNHNFLPTLCDTRI